MALSGVLEKHLQRDQGHDMKLRDVSLVDGGGGVGDHCRPGCCNAAGCCKQLSAAQ